MKRDFTVLRMQPQHLRAVAEIERLCFPAEPWSEQSLGVLCREGGVGYVAIEADGTVSAYVGMLFAAGESRRSRTRRADRALAPRGQDVSLWRVFRGSSVQCCGNFFVPSPWILRGGKT